MICLDFDWQIDEFMFYYHVSQLRPTTMQVMSKRCGCSSVGAWNSWTLELLIKLQSRSSVTTSVISKREENTPSMLWKARRKQTIQTAAVTSANRLPQPPSTTTSAICVCSSTGWIGTISSKETP